MKTPARIRNHPIHPMLVVFPIALWIVSLICDVAYHAGSRNIFWKTAAFYSMAGGTLGALLAAIPGFVDFLSLSEQRAKRIATTHMALNLVVVALFTFNLGIRYNAPPGSDMLGVMLSVIAIALMSISGWLGGTLVYEHGAGVSASREERDTGRRAA